MRISKKNEKRLYIEDKVCKKFFLIIFFKIKDNIMVKEKTNNVA